MWLGVEHTGEFDAKEPAPSLKFIQSKNGATRRGNIGLNDQVVRNMAPKES